MQPAAAAAATQWQTKINKLMALSYHRVIIINSI